MYICLWKQQGERDRQLRLLTGADDKDSVLCLVDYAFRVEEHETDLQVFTSSTDQRALKAASKDIERFVQGITVHARTDKRPAGEGQS